MDNTPVSESPVPSPKHRYARALYAGLLVLVLIGGVGYYFIRVVDAPVAQKTSGKPMTIAKYYWPGFFWIDIADTKGWFGEAGLNVELIDSNADYFQSVTDLAEGKIDVNTVTLFDLVSFISQGKDIVMIVNTDTAFGSEGIVAKQTISDLRALKGKKVGLPTGTYLEYMLDLALKRSQLSPEDIVKVAIIAEDAQKEFATGSYDAVLTWDPYFSDTVKGENGKVLFDSSEMQNVSPEGLTVTRSFMNERPEDLQALVGVWHKTTAFIKENPAEAFGIIAAIYDESVEEVQAFTTKNRILDLRDNKTSFAYSVGFESLHGVARNMNNFLIDGGVTDRQLDSTQFLDARFIRNLEVR